MGKKILVATAAIIALCILLVHTGQFNNVVASITPWAKKGSSVVATGIHSAAPHLPSAPKVTVPKQVSQGAQDVNNTLKKAGLAGGNSDARTPSNAVHVLDRLHVTTTTPTRTYSRGQFGGDWADSSHGCSVTDDALRADLTAVTRAGCNVTSGDLSDPYTGTKTTYTNTRPTAVTVDAVVPLSWAWANGAASWTPAKRAKFADDQSNLTVVTAAATEGKNGQGPSRWAPANSAYLCTYVTRFVYVVNDYGLTINASDQAFIRRDLAMC